MRHILTILFVFFSSQAISEVHRFTLSNGLKVLVKEDHRAPVAVSMVWYNVGSADEPGGITGVSHALEHMMFKGTLQYPAGVFSKTIAAIGGQENAFTNQDYTAFYEKVAATQLPICFQLEADRMNNLILDGAEFAKEIKVIQEERRMRTDDNPQALTYERYLAAAHLAEPYHHPVIGWMNDLQAMKINDLKAWYQHFYAPNNATLVVVGDVDPQKVVKLAEVYFGKLEKKPTFTRKPQREPVNLGAKSVDIYAPAKLPLIMFGYTVPSLKTAEKAWEPYALEIIANILDAGESARFSKNLIRGSQIAGAMSAHYNPHARYQTDFLVFGLPTPGHTVQELKIAALKEIKKLQNEPVPAAELTRIKTQIIAQKTFEKDSIFGQAMELGLKETLGLGAETPEIYKQNIEAITPEQIQQVALRFFLDKAITEARLYPLQSQKQPTKE